MQSNYIIFHLFVVENSMHLINNYFRQIIINKVYNKVEKIFISIRYTCEKTLYEVKKIINFYNKIVIIDYKHYNDPYDSEVKDAFFPNENYYLTRNAKSKLGEIETIFKMFYDKKYIEIKKRYKIGFFIHSKNISRGTEYNLLRHGDKHGIYNKQIINYHHNLKNLNNRLIGVWSNFFLFKSEWIPDLNSFQELLRIFYYDFDFYSKKRNTERRDGNLNHVFKKDSNYVFFDRHILANFPMKMNILKNLRRI